MGMDLWYDVVIQELADANPDGTELLKEAEIAQAPEAVDEADD